MVKEGITLRPITPNDQDFLYHLYADFREEELKDVIWEQMPMDKESFLKMQFEAQHKYYTENFLSAEFMVVSLHEQPIGRLYLHRREQEICLVDIILLPQYRNQGIGTAFLQDILAEAQKTHLPVRLHVEYYNQAIQLYQRLGFKCIEDKGVYKLMEWKPGH